MITMQLLITYKSWDDPLSREKPESKVVGGLGLI